jgi:hypothetical protein
MKFHLNVITSLKFQLLYVVTELATGKSQLHARQYYKLYYRLI